MLSTAGDQVPVNPSIEEEGSVRASPAQIGAIAEKFGIEGGPTLTVIVAVVAH